MVIKAGSKGHAGLFGLKLMTLADPLFRRLERAASSQVYESGSMSSRYGTWANTVRDNLVDALADIDDDSSDASKKITRCINSLSAFAEIQRLFDVNG